MTSVIPARRFGLVLAHGRQRPIFGTWRPRGELLLHVAELRWHAPLRVRDIDVYSPTAARDHLGKARYQRRKADGPEVSTDPVNGSTEADLNSRTMRASGALIAAVIAIAVVRIPVESRAHREVTDETSVRALTIFDVVESTSTQVGLLIAGFLVSATATRPEWLVDPYRVYLLVVTVGIVLALSSRPLRCVLTSEGAAPTQASPDHA